MYVNGSGISEIARYLDDNGIRPRIATAFCTTRLRQILENKTYIGYLKIQNKKIAESWSVGKHKPLIDPDIFEQAQLRLTAKESKIRKDCTPRNPLTTLVKCSVCGKSMVLHHSKGVFYLKCKAFKCPTVSSQLNKIEAQVIEELKEELRGFKYYLDNQAAEDNKKAESRLNEIKILDQAIKKKEKALDTCCELLEEGIYTRDQYFKRVNLLTEERDALKANLEALRAISDDKSETIRSSVPILEKCIEQYYSLSIPDRNKILKSLIEKIVYTREDSTRRGKFSLKIYLKI